MAKKKTSTASKRVKRRDIKKPDLCCCSPRAMLWIDARTECCFIENKIDMQRRLQARADAAAAVRPPGGPDTNAQSGGGSQLDEGTMKDQGKIYRTDVYTVHWKADGPCQPLLVRLSVRGDVQYQADCLPDRGEVTLSNTYLLEPPNYAPPGNGNVTAFLSVDDCAHAHGECENTAYRP